MFKKNKNKNRTIKFILNKLKTRGKLKKRIPHNCVWNKCYPKNILKFLPLVQCSRYSYDTNIYVCTKQKIHFCFDSKCAFSNSISIGKTFCPVTGKSHRNFIADIEIQNKRNRIPSKQYCSIPQDDMVVENHTHTRRMKNRALKLDNYYNNLFFEDVNNNNKDEEERIINDGTITIQFIKKRERTVKFKNVKDSKKRDIVKILNLNEPLLPKSKIFLHSHRLYNFVTYKLDIIDLLLSSEKIKISTHFKKKKKYWSLISNAEHILLRILPGLYRIKKNWSQIETFQTIAYTHWVTYINKCVTNKKVMNDFNLIEMLDFDKYWKNRHTLINWVTFEKWVYFLKVIVRSFMFCERCGQINRDKKSLGSVKHILGVMYTLKKGYTKKVGPVTFKLIPQDIYLNQYGVLLEENKLSSYVEKDARKWVNKGENTFQKFLNKGFETMTDVEIRNIIFP